MKIKKRYLVQWENGQWKSWWTEREFRSRRRAIKYATKMLARNSNVAAWRVIEEESFRSTKNQLRIVFEGYLDRYCRDLEWKYFESFSPSDTEKYYKAPIINGKEKK